MGETLVQLLGDRAAEFLSECWPNAQRHVFATGARERLPALYDDPCAADLVRLLEAHRGPIAAQGFDGLGQYRVESGLDAQTASALLRFGVPVQLYQAQRTIPAIRNLERGLRGDLGLPASTIDSMIFVSPPGRGVLRHFDDKDAWILGLSGHKVLWVAPNHDVPFPAWIELVGRASRAATSTDAPDMPTGAVRVEVGPGDCLYLPRGYWHESANGEEPCFSLTLALHRPTLLDLCLDALRDKLLKLPAFREPFPGLGPGLQVSTDGLARLLEHLPGHLAELDPESVLDAYARRSLLRDHRVVAGRSLEVGDGHAVVSSEPDGEELAGIELLPGTAPVLRAISRANVTSLAALRKQFPDVDAPTLGSILEVLVEADFLESAL